MGKETKRKKIKAERDSFIIECHRLGMRHAEIASDFGISRERVRQIVKRELGASAPLDLLPQGKKLKLISSLRNIESGLSPGYAAIDAGVSRRWLSTVLREEFRTTSGRLAFDAWMGRQIGKRFNDWLVLSMRAASKGSASRAEARAKAVCLNCGNVYSVIYRNIASGTSRMCRSCGARHRIDRERILHDSLQSLIEQMKGREKAG